jgi:2-polyprenyl-3-methyl-5-hydroxy-6-metoxy-1,4-benzoquinol methylase
METLRLEHLNIHEGQRVLDLGCGEGRHSIALNLRFPKAICFALDLNPRDIKTARKKHHEFCGLDNCLYLQGDALSLPFNDASFDVIVCSEVLEHIVDYQSVLQEVSRLLSPGGQFCASVPRAWPEKICWKFSSAYHQVEGGHVRIFNQDELSREISSHRFTLERSHGAHALHVPYWWLRCLFWREHDQVAVVRWYHKLLVWDLMEKPKVTRWLEKLLNPIMGKSIVLYFRKEAN